MRAVIWIGSDGQIECDAPPELVDGTEVLMRVDERTDRDLSGVIVEVGKEVCSFESGDAVTLPVATEQGCRSSSLWGLTEYEPAADGVRLVRVPLAEFNLLPRDGQQRQDSLTPHRSIGRSANRPSSLIP